MKFCTLKDEWSFVRWKMNEVLYVERWSFVRWKIMDIPTSFFKIVILFEGAFEYDDCAKFWGYVTTNAGPFCIEFCCFVQCLTAVNCLTGN
jgi:hypothetical protein